MAKKGYGDSIGSGRTVNTTSIARGNGTFRAQGKPDPEGGIKHIGGDRAPVPTTKPATREPNGGRF